MANAHNVNYQIKQPVDGERAVKRSNEHRTDPSRQRASTYTRAQTQSPASTHRIESREKIKMEEMAKRPECNVEVKIVMTTDSMGDNGDVN